MNMLNSTQILFIAASLKLLTACQSSLNTQDQGASLFAATDEVRGTDIQATDALSRIESYCSAEKVDSYLASITGKTVFQAGYDEFFDGSGSTYPTSKALAPDGSMAIVRSGEAQTFSLNGMGMYAPSTLFNHAEFIKSECDVARGALSNGNKYSQKFSVRSGASFGGSLSDTKLSLSECVVVDAESDNGATHTIAFCPNGFMQKGKVVSSAGSINLAQLVMQAQ